MGQITSSQVCLFEVHLSIFSIFHPLIMPDPGAGRPSLIENPCPHAPSLNLYWKHFFSASHALRQCSKLICASFSTPFLSSSLTALFFVLSSKASLSAAGSRRKRSSAQLSQSSRRGSRRGAKKAS